MKFRVMLEADEVLSMGGGGSAGGIMNMFIKEDYLTYQQRLVDSISNQF